MQQQEYQLYAQQALLGETIATHVYLHIRQERIGAISDKANPILPVVEAGPGVLVPGFIDVQVNGGGGVLFNQQPDTNGIARIFQAHHQFGTTTMLPTLITDSPDVMQRAADAVAQALAEEQTGILGVHFEGPHMSVAKRGVHSPDLLRPLSDLEMAILARKDLGVRVVTVAPEVVSAAQIKELVSAGLKVCLGHSNASALQVSQALEAGASGFTHLYNGMSALTSREPGMVGCALADEKSYAGLILDGHHLHQISAKAAIRAKGTERIMLVTDAMPPVGTEQSGFAFFGSEVQRQGDKLIAAGGSLAGSVLDMAGAVRYAVQKLGYSLAEAVKMASFTPAAFLGVENRLGTLAPGMQADMLLLNHSSEVIQAWIKGQSSWYAPQ
jgi:N-acetylglucosamine-6-phosphate deacetylase